MANRNVTLTVWWVQEKPGKRGPWQLVAATDKNIPMFSNFLKDKVVKGNTYLVSLESYDYSGEERWKAIHIETAIPPHLDTSKPAQAQDDPSLMPVATGEGGEEWEDPDETKAKQIARAVAVKAVVEMMNGGKIDPSDQTAVSQWLAFWTDYVMKG